MKNNEENKVVNVYFNKNFWFEDEMFRELNKVIANYSGKMSLVSAVGVLELVKLSIIEENEDFHEEDR